MQDVNYTRDITTLKRTI